MQSSSRGQIDVDSQLVTELLQLIHHFGLWWRVAPEQGQLWESIVDVVGCGNVSQQHELLHQPREQMGKSVLFKQYRLIQTLVKLKHKGSFWKTNRRDKMQLSRVCYSLVTVSVLVNVAALRHHCFFVQGKRQFQLKQKNKAGTETE